MVTKVGREAARLRPREERGAGRRHERPVDVADDAAGADAAGNDSGTFQYMAPEQIEGLEADARTDIFAFGALLFEMLTGRTAFAGKTRACVARSDPEGRPAARVVHWCAGHVGGHRSRHQHLSRERSGRSLSVGARSSPRSRLGGLARGRRARPRCGLTPGQRGRRVDPGCWLLSRRQDSPSHRSWRSSIVLRDGTRSPVGRVRDSRSRQHVFAGVPGGGTGAATQLAVSPDGQHVAFVTRKDRPFSCGCDPSAASQPGCCQARKAPRFRSGRRTAARSGSSRTAS